MPRFTLELSTLELDVVWRAQAFDDLPLIIDVPSPGGTRAERASLEAQVWTDLVDRELADDHGHATARLVDALRVINHRRQSLELRVFGPDPLRALLAVRGSRAVLAVLDSERFRLAVVANTGLAKTIVSLLPPLHAGRGHPTSVTTTALANAAKATTPGAAWDALQGHGVNRDDARILLEMATGSTRTGQFAAERRAPDGRRSRSPRIVAFYDTPKGRYQVLRKTIGSAEHVTVAPASPQALTRSVSDLVAELREALS